jgi:protein SCO1/2
MNWRLASRLSVITLAILVVVLITFLQRDNTQGPVASGNTSTNAAGLQGIDLGNTPAPDFRLTDQFGKSISLSQFRGQPVVLTFLYTHCPDLCPLTAEKLHTVMQNLGSNAQSIAVLAVSVDPQRDTVEVALNFSKAHKMQDYWHYLIGTQQTLTPIWSSYHVFAQTAQQTVNHTLPVYLIDKQGREQVYLDNDFTVPQLTADLKILLKE